MSVSARPGGFSRAARCATQHWRAVRGQKSRAYLACQLLSPLSLSPLARSQFAAASPGVHLMPDEANYCDQRDDDDGAEIGSNPGKAAAEIGHTYARASQPRRREIMR